MAADIASAAEFGVLYLAADGSERRELLSRSWNVRFEAVPPVRTFPSWRGQRHFPGLWWAATTGDHVGFESWLERDQVMALDFDSEVVAFSSQPFWLSWQAAGKTRRHAPDFFARLRDGTGVVVDVRHDDRIPVEDAEAFAVTARACAAVGWDYRRVGAVDAVLAANLRWLAGYRHPRCLHDERASRLRRVFSEPAPLLAGAREVGDPVAVLPVLFHLLWVGVLATDVASAPLSAASIVSTGTGGS